MKYRKVSLKDIAKEVGVSTATVSYVLSERKENRVSAKVAEKIKKVAKELNYQPNQIAKSLKSGKTNTLGLIVADISNPFFAQIARIIEDQAAKFNYTVVFGSSDEKADKSWNLIQFLLNRQVDGFIIVPTEESGEQIKYLKERQIPFVLIDRWFTDLATNYVAIDNYKASYESVTRLIETGNKKIGMIAYDSSLVHMQDRIRGYKQALVDNGLEFRESWLKKIKFDSIEEETSREIEDILSPVDPLDAVFFATNTLAIQGLRHLQRLQRTIPDDLAVVSFDEGEAFDFFYCPITYVRQPLAELSQKAVEILVDQIADPTAPAKSVVLDTELIIRQSCGAGKEINV